MIASKQLGIYSPRFLTKEDAVLFAQCVLDKKPFPIAKWINPIEIVDGRERFTGSYKNARFEVRSILQSDLISDSILVQ